MNRSLIIKTGFCIAAALVIIASVLAVRVYEQRFSTARVIAECSHLPVTTKALCYTDRVNDVLDHRGLKAALDLVAASYAADPAVAGFCHSNMHDLGIAAYKQFSETGKIDLSASASYCGYGFYHGYITAMMESTGSLKQAVAFCAYVGKTLGSVQSYAEGSCYHGIGHGITDGTDPSTWGDMQKIAAPGLAICEQFAANNEFESRCASGVFNAINVMYFDPQYKLDVHNDPYAICRTVSYDANEKKACYEQMNVIVGIISKYDMPRMLAYAEAIPDPVYRHLAVESNTGRVYAQPPYLAYAIAIANCNAIAVDDRDPCMKGLIDGFMEFGLPGQEYVRALSFCALPDLTRDQTAACYTQVAAYAQGIYSPAVQKTICDEIPASYRPVQQCKASVSSRGQSSIV